MTKTVNYGTRVARYDAKTPDTARAAGNTGTKAKKKNEEEMRGILSQYSEILSASDAHYDAEMERLGREKESALRRAAVNEVLREKYLPTTKKGQGLDGLGVSETARIDERNTYQRTLGRIEDAYIKGAGEVSSKRAASRDSLMKYYGELLRADQDKLYEGNLDRIEKERFTSQGELEKMLAEVSGYLRPEQLAHLKNVASYYLTHPAYATP